MRQCDALVRRLVMGLWQILHEAVEFPRMDRGTLFRALAVVSYGVVLVLLLFAIALVASGQGREAFDRYWLSKVPDTWWVAALLASYCLLGVFTRREDKNVHDVLYHVFCILSLHAICVVDMVLIPCEYVPDSWNETALHSFIVIAAIWQVSLYFARRRRAKSKASPDGHSVQA